MGSFWKIDPYDWFCGDLVQVSHIRMISEGSRDTEAWSNDVL